MRMDGLCQFILWGPTDKVSICRRQAQTSVQRPWGEMSRPAPGCITPKRKAMHTEGFLDNAHLFP